MPKIACCTCDPLIWWTRAREIALGVGDLGCSGNAMRSTGHNPVKTDAFSCVNASRFVPL
jgi:hypothetical protein